MLNIDEKRTGLEQWLYEQTLNGVISTDINLTITFINRWIENYCHLEDEEVRGKNLFEVFPELKKKNIPNYIENALNGQSSVLSNKFHKYIFEIKLAKSEYKNLTFMQQVATISPKLEGNGVTGMILVIENVSDRVSHEMELSSQIEELEQIQRSLRYSEKTLKETLELNESLLKSIPFGMAIVDEMGDVIFQNENLHQLVKKSPEGKKCWELYTNQTMQCIDCPLKNEIVVGSSSTIEDHNHFAGKIYDVSQTGIIYQGKKALLEIFVDITERKQAEDKIRKSEAMFRQLSIASKEIMNLPDLDSIYKYVCINLQKQFENSITIFITIDQKKKSTKLIEITGVKNRMFHKIENLTGFTLLGREFRLQPELLPFLTSGKFIEFENGLVDFTFGEFPEFAARMIGKLLDIYKIYTIGFVKENELLGALHFFTVNQSVIEDADYIELYVKQAAELIQKRQLEIEITKREEKFRTIFEQAPIGIALIDSETRQIYDVNQRLIEMTGLSRQEMIDTNWIGVTHPNDSEIESFDMDMLQSGQIKSFKIDRQFIRKDGHEMWLSISFAKVTVEGDDKNRQLIMIEDITLRKQTQLQLENYSEELKKSNIEKDKFFSIIAHDLRSPFSSFLGTTEYLADNLETISNEDLQEIMQGLQKSASNLYNLLENLLEWARMQRGLLKFNPEKLNLFELVEEVASNLIPVAEKKNISITNTISKKVEVFADRNMLNTILRNLTSNSLKFTRSGGLVQYSSSIDQNSAVTIEVNDTGIGMSPEILKNLFRIDVNVSRPGTEGESSTGLGMLLCKEFVEIHSGKIWAESEVGKGTTMYFTLSSYKN